MTIRLRHDNRKERTRCQGVVVWEGFRHEYIVEFAPYSSFSGDSSHIGHSNRFPIYENVVGRIKSYDILDHIRIEFSILAPFSQL